MLSDFNRHAAKPWRTFPIGRVLRLIPLALLLAGCDLGRTEFAGVLHPPRGSAALGDLSFYDADGEPFSLERLRGGYSVLVFGCPTCPSFLSKLPALDAISEDYAGKGVRFHIVFGDLAHPEYETYLPPYSLEDRVALVAAVREKLASPIPWLIDTPSGDLKRTFAAVADAPTTPYGEAIMPNGQIILDPEGNVVDATVWSDPDQLRQGLRQLVGPAGPSTAGADDAPADEATVESVAVLPGAVRREATGDVSELPKNVVAVEPLSPREDEPFFAKLQVRVDDRFPMTGAGPVCFALRLDPVHRARWDAGTTPQLEIDDSASGVTIGDRSLDFAVPAPVATLARNSDGKIGPSSERGSLTVTVRYAVIDSDGVRRAATQTYAVRF